MVTKQTETKKQDDEKIEAPEVTEPVFVRDYRKKVYNTMTNEEFELDDETAERFAVDPKFYDAVWDPNQNKSVPVSVLKWEGADGQKVGS